ncbi:MAG: hypothetical protein BWX60_00985 [Candidatus Marinimicrobia bacterium ADurb.Bin030]|nr:MAG: hypothetical protein BWX60_00985 [Candidatus Marinimicrobia bacterium ADurb.Bin030]
MTESGNRFDVIMHKKDLTATINLPQDSLFNNIHIESDDFGYYWQARDWRGVDNRKVAYSNQRKI